jgi:hypothetical protein
MRLRASEALQLLLSYNYFKQDGAGPQSDVVPVPRTHECPVGNTIVDARTGLYVVPDIGSIRISNTSAMPYGAACAFLPGIPVYGSLGLIDHYLHPFTSERITAGDARRGRVPSGVFDPTLIEDTHPRKVYLTNTRDLYTSAEPPEGVADLVLGQRNRYWGWTATADWDVPLLPVVGETHAKLLGGFQRTEQVFGQDFDATDRAGLAYSLDPDTADQYSGELQWSGTGFGERLEWKTSMFYLHEQAERDVNSPTLVPGQLGGLASFQTTDNESYGAALHGTLHLTDTLRLSLGGRFVKDRKSTLLIREARALTTPDARFRGCTGGLGIRDKRPGERSPYSGRPYTFHAPVDRAPECSRTYRGVPWGAGIEWRPLGDEHLFYGKLDRGFKSGGFRAGAIGEYEPEKVWAYAVGSKSEFLDQRLRLNLEGFLYNYQALQLVILDGLALRTENTDARMYGWDLEALASPIEGLNLSAVVAFLKTETVDYFSLDPTLDPPAPGINAWAYQQWHLKRLSEREEAEAAQAKGEIGPHASYATRACFRNPTDNPPVSVDCGHLHLNTEPGPFGEFIRQSVGGLDDYAGNDLSRAPKWKVTLSGDYEIRMGRLGSLTPHVQYSWSDNTYFRAFNQDFDVQESYHLTDVKLTWRSPEETWSVEVFVQNIENEAAKLNLLIGPREFGAPPLAWYNPPRFYGVQMSFRY